MEMIAATDGWETFSCDQFADVGRLIHENAIDVLACDYRMPPITGFDVLDHVRKAGFRIPAIMISAGASSIDASRARELGIHAILQKPPDVLAVRDALKNALQRAEQAA